MRSAFGHLCTSFQQKARAKIVCEDRCLFREGNRIDGRDARVNHAGRVGQDDNRSRQLHAIDGCNARRATVSLVSRNNTV